MATPVARRRALAALAITPLALASAAGAAQARAGARSASPQIPSGYAGVDPRTARRVPLWQELNETNPIFEGDPEFTTEIWTTIDESGYLLEHITSLGTHTGTHISAPAHFVKGAKYLSELTESWTLMPLVKIDVRARVAASGGDFSIGVPQLLQWEKVHGPIPDGACVLLFTGFSKKYVAPDYFEDAPGFTGEAAAWLFDRRSIEALGADTFGPDATSDTDFSATLTTLQKGGITVENVGPGLSRMRPFGDWVSINGGRPRFSGFQMGITGFTV